MEWAFRKVLFEEEKENCVEWGQNQPSSDG